MRLDHLNILADILVDMDMTVTAIILEVEVELELEEMETMEVMATVAVMEIWDLVTYLILAELTIHIAQVVLEILQIMVLDIILVDTVLAELAQTTDIQALAYMD